MKNVRIFVILVLLAIASPIAIHYRAWSLGFPATSHAVSVSAPENSAQTGAKNSDTRSGTGTASHASSSETPNPSFNLPSASSSLPLLSVIGFGIFLGGLISALRTRPAHK